MNNLLLNGSAVRYLRLFSALPLLLATDVAMAFVCSNPSNPSGPQEVIECYAASLTPAMTGEEFWNNRLFSTKVLDGFCQKPLSDTTPSPNALETEMYALSCKAETVNYFSYAKFLAADQELKTRLGEAYQFMRQGTKELKQQEFANFLATVALETSGVGAIGGMTQYQQDGLYFRYEVRKPLQICYGPPANPGYTDKSQRDVYTAEQCYAKTSSQFITDYYPVSTWVVAVVTTGRFKGEVNTTFVSDKDCQYFLTQASASYKCNNTPTILGGQFPPPAGYSWQFMNDNKTIPSGYWLGMGNLQLTGDSMTKFFGWYHQNIVFPKEDNADMKAFVESYLQDGKLAWEGGLWYWNFRNSDINEPTLTLHTMLTGPKLVCRDIGITTVLVNGADQCNEATQRTQYYEYFKTQVFKLPYTAIPVPGSPTVTSMMCSKQLLDYCSTFHIGDTGPAGGVVFYITPFSNGMHGMEAAPYNQAATAAWCGYDDTIPGARKYEIGAGATNTADIMAGCNTPDIAARVASGFVFNGYHDWYLPSKDELQQLYTNRGYVGTFTNGDYWSSSETKTNNRFAETMSFTSGVQGGLFKIAKNRVRAIRSF